MIKNWLEIREPNNNLPSKRRRAKANNPRMEQGRAKARWKNTGSVKLYRTL